VEVLLLFKSKIIKLVTYYSINQVVAGLKRLNALAKPAVRRISVEN
jgi:hypothetical protein